MYAPCQSVLLPCFAIVAPSPPNKAALMNIPAAVCCCASLLPCKESFVSKLMPTHSYSADMLSSSFPIVQNQGFAALQEQPADANSISQLLMDCLHLHFAVQAD